MQSNEIFLTNANAPLIKVEQRDGTQLVSARDLYDFFSIAERFSKWIERMFEYGFIENQDYTLYQKVHPQNKQQIDDYILTLDCAKEIAMLQRSEKGKQARQYFIECEKQLNKPKSMAEISLMHAQMLVNIEREQQAQAEKIKMIEAKVSTINNDFFTLSGFYALQKKKWNLSNEQAQKIGKELSALSIIRDYEVLKVSDSKYGKINSYHISILSEYFGKKH